MSHTDRHGGHRIQTQVCDIGQPHPSNPLSRDLANGKPFNKNNGLFAIFVKAVGPEFYGMSRRCPRTPKDQQWDLESCSVSDRGDTAEEENGTREEL